MTQKGLSHATCTGLTQQSPVPSPAWRSRSTPRIAAVEDDHWWYRNTRALSPLSSSDPGCTTRPPHPRRRVRPRRQRRVAGGARRRRSASTAPPTRSRSSGPSPAARRPCSATLDRAARSPIGAFDVVVGGHRALRRRPTTPPRSASWRGCSAPGGAVVLVEPAFESLGAGPRRRRARQAAATGAPGSPRSPPPPASASTRHVRVLVPRAARRRARRARPAASPAPTPPDDSDVDHRALDRVFAPLAEQERRWLAATTSPSAPRSSCSLPADRFGR